MAKRQPARTKYRKVHKGRNRGEAKGGANISFGDFGLQALERGKMSSNQMEAVRVSITRHLKRKGKVWIRAFPQKPITKKPAETRMGKGKGGVDHYVAIVKPGSMLVEVSGVPIAVARQAMSLADRKLPFGCRFVSREELEVY